MEDIAKCKKYTEMQISIKRFLKKGGGLDRHTYMNQLVSLKNDLIAKNETVRKSALETLEFLLSLYICEVQTDIVNTLLDNSVNKVVQNIVLKCIKKKIQDAIMEDKFDFSVMLLPWKNHNINKLTNIIDDVCCNDISRDKCKDIFINKVVPTMMNLTTDGETRNILIDIAFMLSTIVPISDLNCEELDMFFKEVSDKYVKNIGDLRDQNYPNWHNLWIFLVRFCDKNIHNSMDLTNKLLRVVEYAFRNPSIQQRLKGYDCWKELIDNASLDMKHMCSAKQIKLLVTPLKAKFSKQEVVICKRFDVFAYLLEKLQQKAVLCLTEFLEFCFGPVGENKDASKAGQGKTVSQLWTKSTKVLVEIIGHSHGKSVTCLTTEDVIKLEKPIINHINISAHYKVIIHSVAECCILLKEVDIESKRETVIKCMWKSVFDLGIPAVEGFRVKYFQVISDVLDNYIKRSRENPYFEDLLILIFTALMSYDKDFVHEVIQYILNPLLTIIFTTDNFPTDVASAFKTSLSHAFSKMLMMENKLNALKQIMTCFMKLSPSEENIGQINKIWVCTVNELVSDFTVQQIDAFSEFNSFFIWPTFHMHHMDDQTKKQTILFWMKLYRKISLDSEDKKQIIMKELEKIFKNNPLLNPNVVSLLNVMSQFESKFTKEFVSKIMNVSSVILLLPNLKTEEEQKITALVMQYFEPSLECYKGEQNDDVIKNLCQCIEHILCFHKGYKLLDTLASFIRNSTEDLKAKFSNHLSSLILDLYNKETDSNNYSVARELQKVIQAFSENGSKKSANLSPFAVPRGRSARIASLAKGSPKTPKAKSPKVDSSPTALRLFGKDLDTLSPLHVKGSQLKNVSPGRSKKSGATPKAKPKNLPFINDEKSSDFVPIDTEVKFQPEKLNNHQREMLKRRREDIPALYQDLSQSSSQDMFSSSSSRSLDKNNKENAVENKKVIVEVIGHPQEFLEKEEHPLTEPFIMSEVVVAQHNETTTEYKDVDIAVPQYNGNAGLGNQEIEVKMDPEETMYTEMENAEDNKNSCEEFKAKDETNATKNLKQDISDKDEPKYKNSSTDSEDDKEKKRKSKIEAELQKLKMDIVGAEEFVATSRRTRNKDKQKKFDDYIKSKVSLKEQGPRMSLSETKQEVRVEKNRRKTIGTAEHSDSLETIVQKPLENVQPSSPKGSRSTKTKGRFKQKEIQSKGKETEMLVKSDEEMKTRPVSSEDKYKKDSEHNQKEEIRGQKRKHSSCDEESEDIIESSQESYADVTPIFNSSKRRSLLMTSREETFDISEDKTLVQQKTLTMEDFKSYVENKAGETQPVDTPDEVVETNAIIEDNIKSDDTVSEEIFNKGGEIIHLGQEVEIGEQAMEEVVDNNVAQFDEKSGVGAEALTEINTTQDTTMTQETTGELSESADLSQNQLQNDSETQTQSISLQDTQTQDTQTQSVCTSIEDNQPPVLYFDLPKRPELTESERMMCRMDTMSICSAPNTFDVQQEIEAKQELEIKSGTENKEVKDILQMEDLLELPAPLPVNDLPSSPITVETPNRTTELLNNTLDISPINSRHSSDTDSPIENSSCIKRNLKHEMEQLDKVEKESENIQSSPQQLGNRNRESEGIEIMEELNRNQDLPNTAQDIINILEGTALNENHEICETEVGQEVEKISPEVPQQIEEAQVKTTEAIPDQTSEVMQQIELAEIVENLETLVPAQNQQNEAVTQIDDNLNHVDVIKPPKENHGIQERASKLLHTINVTSPGSYKFFMKKRGNLSMSPSSGRIKKLMSGMNQKSSADNLFGEVKEEDILTFSREVPSPLAVPRSSILKRKLSDTSDGEGVSPCAKRKRVNFSDPCLTSQKVFIKDDYLDNFSMEAKCLFPNASEAMLKQSPSKDVLRIFDSPGSSERMSESENIETEPSLEMTNPLILRKDKPIYPKLVECKDNVMIIVKRVTSPMFVNTLMNKLKNKDIKTVGDLAKQSEMEINRFPFKVPVVANVHRALDNYYKKNIDRFGKEGNDDGEARVNGVEKESLNLAETAKPVAAKVDIRTEFKELMERSKLEGVTEELTKIVLTLLDKQQLIAFIRSNYGLEPKDILEQKDFKSAIKHITETISLPSVFEILTESVENSESESVYFDCMIKHSIDKRPLKDLLENRPLNDIKTALSESVSSNVFNREEVIENCLLPLIENPDDISGYLNRISVVQLGDIVIKRLQTTDLKQFLDQLVEAHGGRNVVTSLNNDLFKYVESSNEIIDLFKHCINIQNEQRQSEVMVELFRFISSKLDLSTLLQLHVDLLKRIPNFIHSDTSN